MPPMTIGQVLKMNLADYEQELFDRYFEIVFNEADPDKELAKEIFQAFGCLSFIRFGDTVFTKGEI